MHFIKDQIAEVLTKHGYKVNEILTTLSNEIVIEGVSNRLLKYKVTPPEQKPIDHELLKEIEQQFGEYVKLHTDTINCVSFVFEFSDKPCPECICGKHKTGACCSNH